MAEERRRWTDKRIWRRDLAIFGALLSMLVLLNTASLRGFHVGPVQIQGTKEKIHDAVCQVTAVQIQGLQVKIAQSRHPETFASLFPNTSPEQLRNLARDSIQESRREIAKDMAVCASL